jgi:pilus assembly protein Flp/PilA
MKLNGYFKHQLRRGIAMTEYLIILAIVAVAAIFIVGMFGKQIKSAFTRNTGALGGETVGADASITTSSKDNTKSDDMGKFDANASKGENR